MSAPQFEYRETLVRLEGVGVALGGRPILRGVDLEIKNLVRPGLTQGQVVALLGPSGMGKTTLFRILAGLQRPDEGRVLLGPEGLPVERGSVGVVAQTYPLFEHRSVLGNLTVAGRRAGVGGRQAGERARDLLERFGLEEHAGKYPCQLSGGQRQRVAIVQQFMCSEHLLLMDEPFSGLDVLAVETLCGFICETAAADELNTLIVVTHDIAAAIQVADTIWLLGRDRDDRGEPVPGARVQSNFNLAERGLAWRRGITSTPEFLATQREIREWFPRL